MYQPMPNEYQKSPPPSAPPMPPPPPPPPFDQPPATGIPVAPPPYQYNTPPNVPSESVGKWSTGLCDCCSDCSACCMTCWCPCVTFGQVAEIINQGSFPCVASAGIYGLLCYFTGFACIYSSFYRTKLRRQYLLPESPCPDFLVHCCCECCALSQEYRHLKSLGFDLSLGWRANMERQNRDVTMSPINVPHGMSR